MLYIEHNLEYTRHTKLTNFIQHVSAFPSQIFHCVHKENPSKHPSIFAGKSTSTGKQRDCYFYLTSQLKANGVEKLIYGIDGMGN